MPLKLISKMPELNLLKSIPKMRRQVSKHRQSQKINKEIALKYGKEYFDGSREQGYGGYYYDGRWVPVAKDIISHFDLKPGDKVLDVGCAKGFLVRDLIGNCPELEVYGLDISAYALRHTLDDVKGRFLQGTAEALPFSDNTFSAVLNINVLHNLTLESCKTAIRELERVSKGNSFIQVDAYCTEEERLIFEEWVLTAITYGTPEFWLTIFDECHYTGDYFWTILEADPLWTVRT